MNTRILLDGVPLDAARIPTEFRIFKKGWNATSKGRFLFDDEAAASVLNDFRDQGNELCIDYDHKAVDPDARAGDGKAAGWFALEVRADGLWAVNVRWTPPAQLALSNREWRYFSPAFMADAKSKRVVALINMALTNIPATKHMTPLVCAAKEKLLMAKKEKNPKSKDVEDDSEEEETSKVVDRENDEEDDDDDRGNTDESDESEEDDGSVDEDADEEDDDEDADEEDGEGKSPKSEPVPKSKPKKKSARLSVVSAAQELTGKTRASEIIGAMRAYKHAREQVTVLSERVEKLESSLREERVRKLVARGIRDGKITPALRRWAHSLGLQDIAQLRSYLDQAAPIVALGKVMKPASDGGALVTLTADELKVCELTNVNPELFAKNKPHHQGAR